MIFLFNWVICWFHVNFPGVPLVDTPLGFPSRVSGDGRFLVLWVWFGEVWGEIDLKLDWKKTFHSNLQYAAWEMFPKRSGGEK